MLKPATLQFVLLAALTGCASSAKLPVSAGTGPGPPPPPPGKGRVSGGGPWHGGGRGGTRPGPDGGWKEACGRVGQEEDARQKADGQ